MGLYRVANSAGVGRCEALKHHLRFKIEAQNPEIHFLPIWESHHWLE
jgi:gluconate kinase